MTVSVAACVAASVEVDFSACVSVFGSRSTGTSVNVKYFVWNFP